MADSGFIPRRPRHEVPHNTSCNLILTLAATGQTFAAHLLDLSRQGMKVMVRDELSLDATVAIRIDLPTVSIRVADTAQVRWSKRLQDNDQWAVGLIFERELSWEFLGELFLCGILNP